MSWRREPRCATAGWVGVHRQYFKRLGSRRALSRCLLLACLAACNSQPAPSPAGGQLGGESTLHPSASAGAGQQPVVGSRSELVVSRAQALRPATLSPAAERVAPLPAPTRSPIEQAREHFPLAAPTIPLQELACNARAFVRLTASGFEAYAARPRWRRVAHQAEQRLDSVLAIGGRSYVLLGRHAAYRYYEGERQPVAFARVPQLGLTSIWRDGVDFDALWARYARDETLYRYPLRSQDEATVTLGEERRLPGFDGRLLERLASGAWIYSQGTELRVTGKPEAYRTDDVLGELVALAPARRLDRFWAFDASGQAALFETARGRPVRRREQFLGLPFSVAVRDDVVAVVSVEQRDDGRRWWLQVVQPQQRRRWELPARYDIAGSWEQQVMANRDVCLLPERSWVVVGGRSALEVYDYSSGKLLLRR